MSSGTPESIEPTTAGARLLGDVGGTNARFAISRGALAPERIEVFACADFDGLEAVLRHYLDRLRQQQPLRIEHAAIGVATAVTGDRVRMTNHPWQFSIEATRRALGLKRLFVLNDFTVLAWSLAHLSAHELRQFGGAAALPDAPRALIGAGTGLGVSALLPDAHGGFVALSGEGGHVAFAPANDLELVLWRAGIEAFGGRVSVERLASGPGLEFIYRTLARDSGAAPGTCSPSLDAAEISRRALDPAAADSQHCRRALDAFLGILGAAAGDLALTLGARGGVYIGGGIVPRLADHLPSSPLRARFEDKGRFRDYLEPIPLYLLQSPYPALTGAAAFLNAQLDPA